MLRPGGSGPYGPLPAQLTTIAGTKYLPQARRPDFGRAQKPLVTLQRPFSRASVMRLSSVCETRFGCALFRMFSGSRLALEHKAPQVELS